MKLLTKHFLKKRKVPHNILKTYVKKSTPASVSTILCQNSLEKDGYGTRVICTIGNDPPKLF